MSLDDNARSILYELFGNKLRPPAPLLTIADITHTDSDGFINHVISHIFTIEMPGVKPATQEYPLFDVEWVPASTIVSDNPKYARSELLPSLFARLPSIKPHETFVIKNK